MYGSMPGMGAARIAEDIRRAEAYRRTLETRKGRALAHHGRARAVGRAVASVLLWPIKH